MAKRGEDLLHQRWSGEAQKHAVARNHEPMLDHVGGRARLRKDRVERLPRVFERALRRGRFGQDHYEP
jgi:hypothetical protein